MQQQGMNLVELMIVVMMITILVTMAIPSYRSYMHHSHAAQAQQELQRIAILLEQHKARHFNYRGVHIEIKPVQGYEIELKDGEDFSQSLIDQESHSRSWALLATTNNMNNDNFLMTSTGIRCKTKVATNISSQDCGVRGELW